ncbi:FT-interacting protein 3-like [Solanum dulcamara]|uniref:FT-interacting protein 3-like n=1 Tax=Solanum dulcamara TaxID=45834 RepID=UPI002484D8F8|nr:FT-interacting protein 3-like [Solanum dulcamara]
MLRLSLVPQWYRLEDRRGYKFKGELLLALWTGTQADEPFPEACHSDDALANIRSKLYLLPKLCYLRVDVCEAQDLIPSDEYRLPEVFVKVSLGTQTRCTKVSKRETFNPLWKESLMLVAVEPFHELLILTVEDKVAPGKDEVLGRCVIPLSDMEMRLDDQKPVSCKWYRLVKQDTVEGEKEDKIRFVGWILMRICLEGGYHVQDESTCYSSDLRTTAKHLWTSSIGVLELGILNAQGLKPIKIKDGQATTDAYCVAKYGVKWVATRTITDSLSPTLNEHYTWEVFDPCTVLTIGVFDNCHLQGGDKSEGAKDSRIGKVRICLSTLQTGRVYALSYPLMLFDITGVTKADESYLMHQAQQIIIMRLNHADPPIGKEVVEYMLDTDSSLWSIRKCRVNFFRLMAILEAVAKRFDQICNWRNPITTFLIHILFIILVLNPKLIPPTFFLSLSLISVWNYRTKPMHPPLTDTCLSCADTALPDELSEEFDGFPTSVSPDIISMSMTV